VVVISTLARRWLFRCWAAEGSGSNWTTQCWLQACVPAGLSIPVRKGIAKLDTTCNDFAEYLGVDLTDGYSARQRAVDVCGLDLRGAPSEGQFRARFWQWTYGTGGPTDVIALLPEIRAARGTVMDGPQALASRGAAMRVAERQLGAPGHTPSSLGSLTGPFAGFVRTSVEIFSALDQAGINIGAVTGSAAVAEHYPGGLWRRLSPGMPTKKTATGMAARKAILESFGVAFPAIELTDDHFDACLGALLAAASDGHVSGAAVTRAGAPLFRDQKRLREGEILLLAVDDVTAQRIAGAVRKVARSSASPAVGAHVRPVKVVITDNMASKATPAIAVAGLSDLGARGTKRQRIEIPEFSGHLWLGDHTMFWESHQSDAVAKQTYGALRTLLASPGHEEDLEVIIK
jgi:hypothetical protein